MIFYFYATANDEFNVVVAYRQLYRGKLKLSIFNEGLALAEDIPSTRPSASNLGHVQSPKQSSHMTPHQTGQLAQVREEPFEPVVCSMAGRNEIEAFIETITHVRVYWVEYSESSHVRMIGNLSHRIFQRLCPTAKNDCKI